MRVCTRRRLVRGAGLNAGAESSLEDLSKHPGAVRQPICRPIQTRGPRNSGISLTFWSNISGVHATLLAIDDVVSHTSQPDCPNRVGGLDA